jgi:hypothetical protein
MVFTIKPIANGAAMTLHTKSLKFSGLNLRKFSYRFRYGPATP